MATVGQFINNNWELKNLPLSFLEIEGAHTGENLANGLIAVLENLGIAGNVIINLHAFYPVNVEVLQFMFFQISTITTDSASNNGTLVRALEAYFTEHSMPHIKNSQVRCFLHVLNLGVQDFLSSIKCDAPNEDSADQEDEDPTQMERELETYIANNPIKKVKY